MAGEVIKMVPSGLFSAAFQMLLADQGCLFPVLSFTAAAVRGGEEEGEPDIAFPQSPVSKLLLPLSAFWGWNFRKAKGRAGNCKTVTGSGFTGTVCQLCLLCKVHSHSGSL